MTVATRKWLEIARFELVLQLRRKSTWLFFGFFMFPLIGVTRDNLTASAGGGILFNAPLAAAQSTIIWSLVALLLLAAIAGDAASRDAQTRMEPLMHAAPIDRWAYVGGRFMGAFLLAAIGLLIVPAIRVYAGLLHPGLAAVDVGPFTLTPHLHSYFLLFLPNAFVFTALVFALAAVVRHPLGGYAAAALVLVSVQLAAFVGEALDSWTIAGLVDPSGMAALASISGTWAPTELNERPIGFAGALSINRLLWLGIACACIALTVRRFERARGAGAVRSWQRGRFRATHAHAGPVAGLEGIESGGVSRTASEAMPRAPRELGFSARVHQTLAITRDSLREVLTVWAWLVVPLFVLRVMFNIDAIEAMGAGTQVLPTTDRVLEPFSEDAPPLMLAILMFPVLLAGELIWRERDANIQSIADSTPVPDGVRFVGKVMGLWIVLIALHALAIVAGVLTQVALGWHDFEPAVYLQVVGLRMVDPLIYALFAMSVHVLVNQKHLGHLIVLMAVLVPRILAEQLRLEHPLLLLGSEPIWRHSPISGLDPFLGPVLWFEAYWAAWALVLTLIARLFWVRGAERPTGERLRIALSRAKGRMAAALGGAVALVLLLGGFIYYNTNVLNDYRTSDERIARLVEYERRYRHLLSVPQPQLAATVLSVELYPDRREAEVRGVHHLVNRTAAPIDTIHVAVSSVVETGPIDFGRPARAAVLDDELSHRTYVLDEPLPPGDSLEMSWLVRHAPRGIPAGNISTAVVENGSFISMQEWVPHLGYLSERELSDAGQRRLHGLVERPTIPSLYDVEARNEPANRDLIDLEVTIGTAGNQTAVAPGPLLRTWTENGRSYFHYATDAPIGQGYALFSANYAVRQASWRDVQLEILHHPDHDLNVDRVIRGMQASLEQLSERFGPYPYRTLRFVEYPSAGGSLHAASATIWYQELFSLFDPDRERRALDLPFAVTGHEVAHQWWGGRGARVEGVAFLSESLAWYSAMGVVEEAYGAEHLERLLGFMRESYRNLRPRAGPPLLRASDSFQTYREGPFAMYALREYVGEESVDSALRRFRPRYTSPEAPFATTLDLLAELQAATPDSLQYLLHDLFEENTFWELTAQGAAAQQTQGGSWQVTLDVRSRKVVVDTAGVETEVPMEDWVEIGVFALTAEGGERGEPLYLRMHHIRSGEQTITVTVPGEPAQAGIDPRNLLIDWVVEDNVVDIDP